MKSEALYHALIFKQYDNTFVVDCINSSLIIEGPSISEALTDLKLLMEDCYNHVAKKGRQFDVVPTKSDQNLFDTTPEHSDDRGTLVGKIALQKRIKKSFFSKKTIIFDLVEA